MNKSDSYASWPALPYEEFKPTLHLLHMATQIIGKLKLTQPFEPHWGNVALWLTSSGLTTGPLFYRNGAFNIDIDIIQHQVIGINSWGKSGKFKLEAMSVAEFYQRLFKLLNQLEIDIAINPMPQEIPNPIVFTEDTEKKPYKELLVNAWWKIILNTYRILQIYHARYTGSTPSIGLMWGTFDLRDARYKGKPVPITAANADYIRRNAMDVAQVEAGWWCGNPAYPRPAFFSFTYPEPAGIKEAAILPNAAKWETNLGEFILDYDDLRKSTQPDLDLLNFFESCYTVGAKLADWDPDLIGPGKPL